MAAPPRSWPPRRAVTGADSTHSPANEATMNPTIDPRRISRLRALSKAASALGLVGGGTVLVGWQLDASVLTSILPGRVAMNPLTALSFMLTASALWLSLPSACARRPLLTRAARVAAAVVATIGVVTLVGYAVGANLGLDQLLFRARLGSNRIAPNTGLCFLLLGLALSLL